MRSISLLSILLVLLLTIFAGSISLNKSNKKALLVVKSTSKDVDSHDASPYCSERQLEQGISVEKIKQLNQEIQSQAFLDIIRCQLYAPIHIISEGEDKVVEDFKSGKLTVDEICNNERNWYYLAFLILERFQISLIREVALDNEEQDIPSQVRSAKELVSHILNDKVKDCLIDQLGEDFSLAEEAHSYKEFLSTCYDGVEVYFAKKKEKNFEMTQSAIAHKVYHCLN